MQAVLNNIFIVLENAWRLRAFRSICRHSARQPLGAADISRVQPVVREVLDSGFRRNDESPAPSSQPLPRGLDRLPQRLHEPVGVVGVAVGVEREADAGVAVHVAEGAAPAAP